VPERSSLQPACAKTTVQLAQQDRKKEPRKSHLVGTRKDMTKKWEENKQFFDPYATDPRQLYGTGAPTEDIHTFDLQALDRTPEAKIGGLIRSSLRTCQIRPGTPEHENKDGDLPTYSRTDPHTQMPYWEFSFLGGGGRLVVDAIAGVVYISMHYSTFYLLLDGGHRPAEADIPLAQARSLRDRAIRLVETGRRTERAARIAERDAKQAAASAEWAFADRRGRRFRVLRPRPGARRAFRKWFGLSAARGPLSPVEAEANRIGGEAPRAAAAAATALAVTPTLPRDGKEEKKRASSSVSVTTASRSDLAPRATASSAPPAAAPATLSSSATTTTATAPRARRRVTPNPALTSLGSMEDAPAAYQIFRRR